jgi:hypothetical protein
MRVQSTTWDAPGTTEYQGRLTSRERNLLVVLPDGLEVQKRLVERPGAVEILDLKREPAQRIEHTTPTGRRLLSPYTVVDDDVYPDTCIE